jgi:hypothetical protein
MNGWGIPLEDDYLEDRVGDGRMTLRKHDDDVMMMMMMIMERVWNFLRIYYSS